MNKIPLLLAVGLTLASSIPSTAVPIIAKDAKGDVFLSGLGSYQQLEVQYPSIPLSRNASANECGFLAIRTSAARPITQSSSLSVDGGTAFTVSSLPVEAAPRCTQGQLTGSNMNPSPKLRTAEGDIYITGLNSFSDHSISYNDLPTVRNVRSDTCGGLKISQSEKYKLSAGDSISIKDRTSGAILATVADFSTLTTVSGGPICRRGTAYTADDWPGN